jgi:peptidoglycan hydrolase CwlO-like protein
LLQTIARDLANLERTIEQLKANQQQMADDNAKAIGEMKASQEEMKRALAKASTPAPKASAPAAPPPSTVRRFERPPPQVRSRPRYPREWMYEDDW